ncbi:hypothetical protein SPV_2503 [Streptococcus pneumoniae]|nr:hypothetical protein SPV_2503 [Streptococcus pneumoniae]
MEVEMIMGTSSLLLPF